MSRRLGAHYKVFAIDLRNHGRSPHSDIFDYDVMAADLLEFMEQQALRRIMLLGHSMGGKVAMQFAIDYSEQYDRLVIVDIAPTTYESIWKRSIGTTIRGKAHPIRSRLT